MTELDKSKQLFDVNFERDGCHLALVHKEQGGAANGYHEALITKSTDDIQEEDVFEFVQKEADVRVSLPFDEFLRKFFNMYYDDALALSKLLGYDPKELEQDQWYREYIDERLENITILKSLHVGGEDFCKLPLTTQVGVLKTQEVFEKATSTVEKGTEMSDKKDQEVVELKKSLEQMQAALEAAEAKAQALEQEKAERAYDGVITKASELSFLSKEEKESLQGILKSVDVEQAEKILSVIEKASEEQTQDDDMFVKKSTAGESDDSSESDLHSLVMAKINK